MNHIPLLVTLTVVLVIAACSPEPSPATSEPESPRQTLTATTSAQYETPSPTATLTPEPTGTAVPATPVVDIRATVVAEITATEVAQPTETPRPPPTHTPTPTPVHTNVPAPATTITPEPPATAVPVASTMVPQTATPSPATATPTPSSTSQPAVQKPDRVALLEELALRSGNASVRNEWAFAYALQSEEFQARCTLNDYVALMTVTWAIYGVPEGSTYVLDGVRIEGDYGWIDSHLEKDGVSMDLDTDGDVEPEVIWRNGAWDFYVSPQDLAKDNLCSLDMGVEDPAPTNTPDPSPTDVSANQWHGLEVADENRCSPYDPDDYPYSQSVEARIVGDMGGIVYSPYTGSYFASTRETDIEHIVARSEAHDSGLCGADEGTRSRFASDPLNLTLASPSVNRHQKSGKDAAEWMPDLNRCWFANRVVRVRQEYGLTIDRTEADALAAMLSGCSSFEMVVVSGSVQVTPTPSPVPLSGADALAMWDDNGNGRISCAEARNHGIAPVRRGHPAYPYMNDRDGDGIVCE